MIAESQDKRNKGAFYTPLIMQGQIRPYLARELGEGWEDRYYVWDPCTGDGRLLYGHPRPDLCFASTLDQPDIDLIERDQLLPGVTTFRYDFLNDDMDKVVRGDSLTGPGWILPERLRHVLKFAPHSLIILMNPPYGRAGQPLEGESKDGMLYPRGMQRGGAECAVKQAYPKLGTAGAEVSTLFLYRASLHRPMIIAAINKLVWCNSPQQAQLRERIRYSLIGGFVVSSQLFPDVRGRFPIAFHMFNRLQPDNPEPACFTQTLDILELGADGTLGKTGSKIVGPYERPLINAWTPSPKGTVVRPPLSSAIQEYSSNVRCDTLSEYSLGYLASHSSDVQQSAQQVLLLTSPYGNGHGWSVTPDNLRTSVITFAVRKAVDGVWENEHDQFTVPALGYLVSNGSDVQHSAQDVFLLSAPSGHGQGWSVTPDNLRTSVITFAVRKAVDGTWENDRDQFTVPALGYLVSTGADVQNSAQKVFLLSSPYGHGDGWSVTPENLRTSVITFAARKAVDGTWENDYDQFTVPALGYLHSGASDVQQSAQQVLLLTSPFGDGHGWSVTPENLRTSVITFAVRKAVDGTWENDRDQFTVPAATPADVFYGDCLVYMLFHNSNQTSSLKDVEYKGTVYQIRNEFYPFELEGQFTHIYGELLTGHVLGWLSPEARACLDKGQAVYDLFRRSQDKLDLAKWRISYPDAGWYQVRRSLAAAGLGADELAELKQAHTTLRNRIQPKVYEYGFMR